MLVLCHLLRNAPPYWTFLSRRDTRIFDQAGDTHVIIDREDIVEHVFVAVINGEKHRGDVNDILCKLIDSFHEIRDFDGCGKGDTDLL